MSRLHYGVVPDAETAKLVGDLVDAIGVCRAAHALDIDQRTVIRLKSRKRVQRGSIAVVCFALANMANGKGLVNDGNR